jgi:hypothetical protein
MEVGFIVIKEIRMFFGGAPSSFFTPQRRVTGKMPPNLADGAAALGGGFPSMPRATLVVTLVKIPVFALSVPHAIRHFRSVIVLLRNRK